VWHVDVGRGIAPHHALQHIAERGIGAVSEQHRTGLGAQRLHVPDPVILLVGPGQLMTLDGAGFIGGDRGAAGEAGLAAAGLLHAVDEKARAGGADHRAACDQGAQIRGGAVVNLLAVRVGAVGKIDLGARNMKEIGRLAGGARAGLFGAYHIIGRGDDFRRPVARGEERGEGRDEAVLLACRQDQPRLISTVTAARSPLRWR
jgi:hypothetical protein